MVLHLIYDNPPGYDNLLVQSQQDRLESVGFVCNNVKLHINSFRPKIFLWQHVFQ